MESGLSQPFQTIIYFQGNSLSISHGLLKKKNRLFFLNIDFYLYFIFRSTISGNPFESDNEAHVEVNRKIKNIKKKPRSGKPIQKYKKKVIQSDSDSEPEVPKKLKKREAILDSEVSLIVFKIIYFRMSKYNGCNTYGNLLLIYVSKYKI